MKITDEMVRGAERLAFYLRELQKGSPLIPHPDDPTSRTELPPDLALSRAQSLSFGLNSQIQSLRP